MELILFLIAIMANIIHGQSYKNVSEAYSEYDIEHYESENAREKNISKRSYNPADKSICWLTGPSFALRSEEELLYQPYENQTDLILTSRDCLSHPVRITLNHKNLNSKILHFFLFNQLYVYMDNQTIFRSRRNIVSRLFCKKGHSTIVFTLSNKSIKVSYKSVHRFGKRCPKSFLNNSQIYNYRDTQRRIPHMDLLFGIMIILVILVTCFLRLIYWFRIKALSQQRQARAQQRRNLIDLTRPGRVNRRVELPPSYSDIQQQEEPPPSYDTVYKRLLETSESPSVNYKVNSDGDSPRLECISDPPPEYFELYDNLLVAINGQESNTDHQIDDNITPERNNEEATDVTSTNYEETSFSKSDSNTSDQAHIDIEDISKTTAHSSSLVDDKVEDVTHNSKVKCTKDEVNLVVPLNLSDTSSESNVLNERESNITDSSTTKSSNSPVNV